MLFKQEVPLRFASNTHGHLHEQQVQTQTSDESAEHSANYCVRDDDREAEKYKLY